MRVARDREQHSRLARGPCVGVSEVEPVGLRVDLEERLGREGGVEHARKVDVSRPAAVDLARGQMADAVDIRVLHRREHPLGGVLVERCV